MRLRQRELPLPGLPAELDGLRIGHLSDWHLGAPSRGAVAVERAVDWVAERRPDLVCVTGDLVSRPRGVPDAQRLLERLGHPYVILGNHDYGEARDPFSRPATLKEVAAGELLRDRSVEVEVRGRRIELAGMDARTWLRRRRGGTFAESGADLRILLCHFPRVFDYVPAGRWDLILAGHLHAGQIVVPYGRGKLLLAHPSAPYREGVFRRRDGTTMHVSPGLGTTFVPFRFCARPEATELILRRAG